MGFVYRPLSEKKDVERRKMANIRVGSAVCKFT
jgi:hypothetical protein